MRIEDLPGWTAAAALMAMIVIAALT